MDPHESGWGTTVDHVVLYKRATLGNETNAPERIFTISPAIEIYEGMWDKCTSRSVGGTSGSPELIIGPI